MNRSVLSDIISKFQTIISNPSQLFMLVIFFGIAILLLQFLLKSITFILRLVIAAVIIGAIVWFFF